MAESRSALLLETRELIRHIAYTPASCSTEHYGAIFLRCDRKHGHGFVAVVSGEVVDDPNEEHSLSTISPRSVDTIPA